MNSLINIDNDGEVIVSVEIQPLKAHKDFINVPIVFNSLKENLKISEDMFVTRAVSFTLLGEKLFLEKMTNDSVSVSVDCQDIEQPGEYELELLYSIPDKTKLFEPYQESVTIKIEQGDSVFSENSDL